MTKAHVSGGLYSADGFYSPVYTYKTLPNAASVEVGTSFWTSDAGQVKSDGARWINVDDYLPVSKRVDLVDIKPVYSTLWHDGQSLVSSGLVKTYSGGLTDANTFANGIVQYGVEFGWNAGLTSIAASSYVGIQKTFSTAWDLSNTDRLFFEMGFKQSAVNTRINLLLTDGSGNIMIATTVPVPNSPVTGTNSLLNSTEKPPTYAIMLLKSDFQLFSGASFNWATLTKVTFRLTTYGFTAAGDKTSMVVWRMTAGQYTKPKVVISCDDIATYDPLNPTPGNKGLMAMYDVCVKRKVRGTHFVTDNEISNGGTSNNKMTQSQVQAWVNAGWNICCHNMMHNPYGVTITAYSKVGTVVTFTAQWGSATNVKGTNSGTPQSSFTVLPDDYITVSRCTSDNVNGTWKVITCTVGTASTTITVDVGNSTAIDNQTGESGIFFPIKYDVQKWNSSLRNVIKQQGYRTNDAIMAYTYGMNDQNARDALARNGVRIARTTGGPGTASETFSGFYANGITQIAAKYGITTSTRVDGEYPTLCANSKLMTLTTAAPTMDGVTLNGALSNSTTPNQTINFTLTSGTNFIHMPTSGVVYIDSEAISYTGKTMGPSNLQGAITGCTRGVNGTAVASHLTAAAVSINPVTAVRGLMEGLLPRGGLLSLYWHAEGDTTRFSDQDLIDLINYLADLRDGGQIELITFEELDAMISSRKNPDDVQN